MKIHLMRTPLPWRTEQATECGMLAHKVKIVQAKDFTGGQRCSICRSTVKNEGPNALLHQMQAAIGRGLQSYRILKRPTKGGGLKEYRRRVNDPILFELKALADLVVRHREEFEKLVAANESEQAIQGAGAG